MAAVSVLTNVVNEPMNGNFSCTCTVASSEGGTAIYCGFIPNHIVMQQVGGSPGATWHSEWHKGMTAAYATLVGNTGTASIITSAGFTQLAGTSADPAPAFVAAASPLQAGEGFYVDTGVTANSLVYHITATR